MKVSQFSFCANTLSVYFAFLDWTLYNYFDWVSQRRYNKTERICESVVVLHTQSCLEAHMLLTLLKNYKVSDINLENCAQIIALQYFLFVKLSIENRGRKKEVSLKYWKGRGYNCCVGHIVCKYNIGRNEWRGREKCSETVSTRACRGFCFVFWGGQKEGQSLLSPQLRPVGAPSQDPKDGVQKKSCALPLGNEFF